jgi:hypothetical protein
MSANDGVTNAELLDLIQLTRSAFPFMPKFDVLLKYQRHEAFDRLFRDDSRTMETGNAIEHRVQVNTSGAAKQTQPYAVDSPTVSPQMKALNVSWTYHQTDYTIERHELLQNRGNIEKIGDLLNSRRIDAMNDSADLLEELLWNVPLTITDTLNPFGIPYWLVPITGAQVTSATSGYQGQNPLAQDAGQFTTTGGIDASATGNERWKSYNDVWSNSSGNVEEDDLDKMRRAFRKLNWKAPQTTADLSEGAARNLRFYAGDILLTNMERAARAQNDQLGSDIGKFAETTSFKRVPIEYVPVLDTRDSAANTVYGQYPLVAINWSFLKIAILKGDMYRETGPLNSRDQHNVFTTFMDLTYQMFTRNRQRLGFIISYVAAA